MTTSITVAGSVSRPNVATQQFADTPSFTAGARFFVWGTWALMLIFAIRGVVRYGGKVPFMDEWGIFVPVLIGEQSVTFEWLWAPHNGHRILLPRIILLPLLKLSGGDFRLGMLMIVAMMAGIALAMIRGAQRLRGGSSYADAFFPLALLHWGHAESMLQASTIGNILVTLLAGFWLLLAVEHGTRMTVKQSLLVALCLFLLPFCAAPGPPFTLTGALWLGCVAVSVLRSARPQSTRNAILILTMAGGLTLLVVAYFVGLPRSSSAASPSTAASISTTIQFLCVGFGPAVEHLWPLLKYLMPAGVLLAFGLLAATWWGAPQERLRVLGIALFLCGVMILALGVGASRAGLGWGSGFAPRYAPMAVLGLCCLYFIFLLYAPSIVRHLIPMTLLSLCLVLLLLNFQLGFQWTKAHRVPVKKFEHDLLTRFPMSVLLARHGSALFPFGDELEKLMWKLKQSKFGIFQYLILDAPTRDVAVPVVPSSMHQVKWQNKIASYSESDPQLLFTLPRPLFVHSIRITCDYIDRSYEYRYLQLFWSKKNNIFNEQQGKTIYWSNIYQRDKVTFYLNETINSFRIDPDNKPGVFRLSQITLVVPDAEPNSPPIQSSTHRKGAKPE